MSGQVVVVGGAVVDLHARAHAPLIGGTSNPSRIEITPGGVGRNIAESLARLGTPVALIAAVGADAFGDVLLGQAREVGIDTSAMIVTASPTGSYLAVLQPSGDLQLGLADLSGAESVTVDDLERVRGVVAAASWLVVDTNLSVECLGWLLDVAAGAGVCVVVDPVSVAKAERLAAVLDPSRPIAVITPNSDELDVLPKNLPGVGCVWERMGAAGSRLIDVGHTAGPSTVVEPAPRAETTDAHHIAPFGTTVVDVTGAGDAATAGLVHALCAGATLADAARFGQACAAVTVASPHTVRPDLTDALVRSLLSC